MEKKVRICDGCKKVMTKKRCPICEKDLCGKCKRLWEFDFGKNEELKLELYLCKDCDNYMSDKTKHIFSAKIEKELINQIMNELKQKMMVEKL